MHTLYARSILLFFIFVWGTMPLYAMEIVQDQPTIPVFQEVPSLKKICFDYIGMNAKECNLINNLDIMPAELTEQTILCADYLYMNKHKGELLKLARSKELDSRIACAIAHRFINEKLVRYLAQEGPITNEATTVLVYNFLNRMDLTTCLNNFSRVYNATFPEESLHHGNDGRLYKQFMRSMTNDIYCFECIPIDNGFFSVKDFEHNVSKKEITHFVTSRFTDTVLTDTVSEDTYKNSLLTLSPCRKFFASLDNDGTMKIHNLKTKTEIETILLFNGELPSKPCNNIVFSKDCLQLGVLCNDNQIYSVDVPTALLSKTLSLSDLAALTYCKKQLDAMIAIEFDDQQIAIENIVFQNDEDAYALDNFIRNNPIINSFLIDFCYEPSIILEYALNWSDVLTLLAKTFRITKVEMAVKLAGNNFQFINHVINILDQQNRSLVNATFFNDPSWNFFHERIVPIASELYKIMLMQLHPHLCTNNSYIAT